MLRNKLPTVMCGHDSYTVVRLAPDLSPSHHSETLSNMFILNIVESRREFGASQSTV